MNIVIFDLETGGLDPQRHPITQIGAVVANMGTMQEVADFEVKIKIAEKRCDSEALAKNSYDPAVWATQAMDADEACARLAKFLKKNANVEKTSRAGRTYFVARRAAYNAPFDNEFLLTWWGRRKGTDGDKVFLPSEYSCLCILDRVRWFFEERPELTPPDDFKLTTVVEHFGGELHEAHDALADARASFRLYKEMRHAGVRTNN